MKRLIIYLLPVISSLSLFLAPAVTSAQVTQQDINNAVCTGSNLEFSSAPTPNCGSSATNSINHLVHTIVNYLSAIVGIIAVIMIIIGGLRYITSGGNDQNVTSAKNTILYAIIGLLIVALAQIIVHFTLSRVANS